MEPAPTVRALEGFVVPMPTNPAWLIVRPEEVALKAPAGVRRNLSESELSKPRNQASVPASWNVRRGSPWAVLFIDKVVVAIIDDPEAADSVRSPEVVVRVVAPEPVIEFASIVIVLPITTDVQK